MFLCKVGLKPHLNTVQHHTSLNNTLFFWYTCCILHHPSNFVSSFGKYSWKIPVFKFLQVLSPYSNAELYEFSSSGNCEQTEMPTEVLGKVKVAIRAMKPTKLCFFFNYFGNEFSNIIGTNLSSALCKICHLSPVSNALCIFYCWILILYW